VCPAFLPCLLFPFVFSSFPIDEATASARYLQQKHKVHQRKIVADTWSLDTIGNAYFAAAMICEPMGYRKLLVGMAFSSVYPGLLTNVFRISVALCVTTFQLTWVQNAP